MARSFDPSAAAGKDGIFGLPHTPEEARIVLVPVPWEATVSYGAGTADGPSAILEASRQVDLLDRDTGRPYESGLALLPIPEDLRSLSNQARAKALPVIEAGGPGDDPEHVRAVAEVQGLCERMNAWVEGEVAGILGRKQIPGVVGGDHSVSLGALRAVTAQHPGLGILHIDAHADLRAAYEGFRFSHASIMRNVLDELAGVARIVQVGIRDYCDEEEAVILERPDRLRTYFDSDLRQQLFDGDTWTRIVGRIVADLPREVYVSFDIDGLDPALCPHTGTPVVGGLAFPEAVALLRGIVDSGRQIVGFDLTEVAPDPEGRTQWDGAVGARVLYKLAGFTLLSRR